jgi:hypothetical protein
MHTRRSSAWLWLILSAPLLILAAAISETATVPVMSRDLEQQHQAGTETGVGRDASGYPVQIRNTYDDQGRLIKREEDDRNGKLVKRTVYTYPKGFKTPNASTTEFGADGKTPKSITNEDFDKEGNPTSTVTTNYDGEGKETGGSKRERDAKTGKERCYNWNAAKQVYEEINCPKLFVSQVSDVQSSPNADVQTNGGLMVVTFKLPQGLVKLNLPDDLRPGDTISGTVVMEPKGDTPEEKGKSRTVLEGVVIDLEGTKVRANNPNFSWQPPTPIRPGPVRYQLKIVEVLGRQTSFDAMSGAVITPPGTTPSGAVVTPDPKTTPPFVIPPRGQAGRPIEINGPFDGNSSNTKLNWRPGGRPEKMESDSGELGLIAESPRKAVFTAPSDVTGSIDIHLKEGSQETRGTFRSVGVNLSAPKTNLVKGEKTTLTIQVSGLEGIKSPVPLTLTSQGVIMMEGGAYQPLVILPSQVGADGRYSTTRGITGLQAGGWAATATVVTHAFDTCLQDDASGNLFIFDPKTGDYIFSQPDSGASKAVVLPWIAQTRGALAPSNDVNLAPPAVTNSGCKLDLNHKASDRQVQVTIDTCAKTGQASVQAGKAMFTIKDRNIADNTCAPSSPK